MTTAVQRPAASGPERLARGLGWFSIGLGLAELAAPRQVARTIGLRNGDGARPILLALGIRELTTGVAIVAQPWSAAWLWTRVGGDLLDLALLGAAFTAKRANRNRLAAATAAVAGVTMLDVIGGRRLGRAAGASAAAERGIHITKAITVNHSSEEVYRFWRDLENLPRFMFHLESVHPIDSRRSRWTAKAPGGGTIEWEAEIIDDRPGELIAWRSLEGAEVPNAGSVRFAPAPGGRGTEVHVDLHYQPPGGAIGATVAKLFGKEPGQQVASDLRRFKQVLETGEVVQSDASRHRGMHPARPTAEEFV